MAKEFFQMWMWKDWFADPAVRRLSAASRGVWHDLLGLMWMADDGAVTGTAEELARSISVAPSDIEKAAQEVETSGAGEVTRYGLNTPEYTFRNRRLTRESNARKSNADKQKRFRDRHKDDRRNPRSNHQITPYIHIHTQNTPQTPHGGLGEEGGNFGEENHAQPARPEAADTVDDAGDEQAESLPNKPKRTAKAQQQIDEVMARVRARLAERQLAAAQPQQGDPQ